MTWRENIERAREAPRPLYVAQASPDSGTWLFIAERDKDGPWAALADLTAQIEERERGTEKAWEFEHKMMERATEAEEALETAEQRVKELEGFVEWAIGKSFDPDSGPWQDKFLQRARAALVQSDPPEDSE